MFASTMPQSPFEAFIYPVQQRNTVADWMFYDVGALTPAEISMLTREINREGSILVVGPAAAAGDIGVHKFENFDTFRAEPGDLLRHFTIAGVGSSDVGAAALARSLANHLHEPVGAIVAGYGVADLLSEAVGGWFFFGARNRMLDYVERVKRHANPGVGERALSQQERSTGLQPGDLSPDTRTLLRLLSEPEREVKTLLGHSKGCLSIAYAMQTLADREDASAFDRARNIDIVTTGAVVAFPQGLNGVRQYLGSMDWFGGLNSRRNSAYFEVPDAWHHLNAKVPLHMDLQAVLAGEFDVNPKTLDSSGSHCG